MEKRMQKIYTSTRNKDIKRTPKEAILAGMADDGGLYVYDGLDEVKLPIRDMMEMSYAQMAETILSALLPDFTEEEVKKCVQDAYANRFDNDDITPLHIAKDVPVLELFHGPTCAFKDVGLRMLPQLMSTAIQSCKGKDVMILTATSGDTGKAALEGFKDVEHIGITVFYPDHGVSNMQKLQMVTTSGQNTKVCAIQGNFDDAQSNVKKIFQDQEMKERLNEMNTTLSSANSINIGRLISQIVYYVFAYKEMVRKGKIRFGEEINFCVPTGNYGNVLAGYYAKCMGLPVKRFLVASNANHVLYDFLTTGIYDRNRSFFKTISPSMDILISSNLERLLYYKSGKDADYIHGLMKSLEEKGSYQVRSDIFKEIQKDFYGGYCDDETCAAIMKEFYEEKGYVLDPHTAVGYKVMKDYQKNDATPCVLLATASPYKFAPAVENAIFQQSNEDEFACMEELQRKSGARIPDSLLLLQGAKIRHKDVIDKEDMRDYVEKTVKEMFHD